nr:MAG TPA: hypothetical protein [Caudoviricetes sp.]
MICILDKYNTIINIINSLYPSAENERTYYPWNKLWELYTDIEPFSYMQERLLESLRLEFVKRRDAIRFMNLPSGNRYGFDCAPEDITNFMASYTPLLVAQSGSTGYTVWLDDEEKNFVILDYADFVFCYKYVSDSQKQDYVWYKSSKAKLLAVSEADGKEKLQQVYDFCVASPSGNI